MYSGKCVLALAVALCYVWVIATIFMLINLNISGENLSINSWFVLAWGHCWSCMCLDLYDPSLLGKP